MVIGLGSMELHDFGRRLRASGVWSSGWAVWGYMTLAEGLEPQGCGHLVGQYGVNMTLAEGFRGVVIGLGSMGLHDFGRRLRAPGVWSSGWAVWGYMTLAEGLES